MKLHRKKSGKLRYAVWVLIVLVVSVSSYAYYAANSNLSAPKQAAPVVSEATEETSDTFAALSEVPVRIVIEKIGVDAVIEPVGLTADGLMDAPKTNELVGWYDKSARAGEDKFAMLLDGHYGSDTRPAVFRELVQLVKGDEIKVTGEKGTTLTYEVVEMERQFTEDIDMKKALYPYQKGKQSLTIITCEGEYDAVNNTYDRRTIVYAERVL